MQSSHHQKIRMYSQNNNKEIMISLDIKDTIRELFDSLLHRYQLGLKQVMKGSNIMSTVRTEIKLKSNK